MKKVFSKKLKIIYVLLICLIVIYLILSYFENSIRDILFPIYTVKDKTSNVLEYQKKYPNSKFVGWIKVQGTNIDYPIVYNNQKEDEKYDYAWMNDDISEIKDFMPILGHNILNVSSKPIISDDSMVRFEQLMSFIYSDFSSKNKYFQITIGDKNYLYQIYAVSVIPANEVLYHYYDFNNTSKNKYIKKNLSESLYKYNVNVNSKDYIASLYTCTRMFGYQYYDLKVDGKLVKNVKKGYNYGMHEKENYKKIKNVIKGDGKNV